MGCGTSNAVTPGGLSLGVKTRETGELNDQAGATSQEDEQAPSPGVVSFHAEDDDDATEGAGVGQLQDDWYLQDLDLSEEESQRLEAAATKIQARQRGRMAREDIEAIRLRQAEMEARAEVYRGVVKAAEAARDKVQAKVAEELQRLEDTRCGPIDAEYERAMEDYDRIADEVDHEIHAAELMLDEALRKCEEEERKANENMERGVAAMAIAQTPAEKAVAQGIIDDAQKHLSEAAYLSKRAAEDEKKAKKDAQDRLAMARTRGEAVIQRKKFSDGTRIAMKTKADAELDAAERRVSDAEAVVERVENEIRETLDKEYAARMKVSEVEKSVGFAKKTEEELSGIEAQAVELAKSPQIRRLAQETEYDEGYLATLQLTMSQRSNSGLEKQKGKQRGSTSRNFIEYLERASVFREGAPLSERIAYIFKTFDKDADGKLGHEDLQNVIGEGCTDEVTAKVMEDISGKGAQYVLLEELISYAERVPGVGEALTVRARGVAGEHGLASQLANKPLVLIALKHNAKCLDDDDGNDDFEGFVRTLSSMEAGKPLRSKLEIIWDALDENKNEFLDEEEVSRIAQLCEGAEAETVIAQLQMLRESIPGGSTTMYQGIPKVTGLWNQDSFVS